jgi:hypothetical protein
MNTNNARTSSSLLQPFLCILVLLISHPTFAATPVRQAYFGDTHVHTLFSFDAFNMNVRSTPDDAYRYAKGETLPHPSGAQLRLDGPPLDFLMVSDHAIFLGVFAAQIDTEAPFYGHPDARGLVPDPEGKEWQSIGQIIRNARSLVRGGTPEFMGERVWKYTWERIIEAAERHNDPGTFTTFIGYEYTLSPGSRHLHRNVVFAGSEVPYRPFSSNDSDNPEDLWDWMETLRADGIDSLAIPHNMNQSDGLAFQTTTFEGQPINREYAEKRMRNEPIAEITQQKGTSETHPLLSPNDEWANFQIVQYYLDRENNRDPISVFRGGYYRDALLTGLQMQDNDGFNPYQLGAIGASDTHVAAAPFSESNYFTSGANTPVARGSVYPDYENLKSSWDDFFTPRQATHGTGGLAGVWAEDNTRSSLFSSMRRRETFATSGPRIRVRFFGGSQLPKDVAKALDPVAVAYTNGVPMGGMLEAPSQNPPTFFVWAARDPKSAPLQRAQIIKGWVENGEAKEIVFDVACADGIKPDPTTHRCADNGASVDLANCSISHDKGAVELQAGWTDPNYQPNQHAFYYARVLENPSCRWSTWDAIRLGVSPNPDLQPVHQERAWSSPIWYQPRNPN